MSEGQGLFGRVSRWFRRRFGAEEDLPLLYGQTEATTTLARRPLFGFPWSRKEEDLTVLQAGLTSMTALMTSLRQYLDQQNARHEELLTYLSQLSQALQAIHRAENLSASFFTGPSPSRRLIRLTIGKRKNCSANIFA